MIFLDLLTKIKKTYCSGYNLNLKLSHTDKALFRENLVPAKVVTRENS